MIYIGIDPGDHTGIAVWDTDSKKFLDIKTTQLHKALAIVQSWNVTDYVRVIFEDARQRKYLPREKSVSEYRGKLMGAGSVKRDCTIWEEFLTDNRIPYDAIPPQRGATKWSQEQFQAVTGWKGRTSDHARDASILVFGR